MFTLWISHHGENPKKVKDFNLWPSLLRFIRNHYKSWSCSDNRICYLIAHDVVAQMAGEAEPTPIHLEPTCGLGITADSTDLDIVQLETRFRQYVTDQIWNNEFGSSVIHAELGIQLIRQECMRDQTRKEKSHERKV